jgi:MFS family permease
LFNLSWLAGPLIAGFLSERYGIKFVFIISGFLMLIALILLRKFKLMDNRKTKKIEYNLFKIIREFFSKKKFVLNYIVSGGVNFWWAFIYIYIPVYIIESGKSDLVVGYFLAGVIAPLILLEYLFGKSAGDFGFKRMFFRGYLILVVVCILCFFVGDMYAILVLLVFASVGVAMLEPTTEAHFFSIATKDERDKFYGIYNTAIDVNYVVSLFLVAILLEFFEFRYAFLLVGALMAFFALISLRVKNEVRRKH